MVQISFSKKLLQNTKHISIYFKFLFTLLCILFLF